MSTKAKQSFDLTRKEAADFLQVSTRTLDRYISKQKFEIKNIAGRVFLKSDALADFMKKSRPHASIKKLQPKKKQIRQVQQKRPQQEPAFEEQLSEDLYKIPVEYVQRTVVAEETDNKQVSQNIIENTEEKVYQKLYNELKSEVKTHQHRLEGANYRVGQLESQLKVSVPLLDHQKLIAGNKKEKFNKRILYILLGAVLALQPLWLILVYI